MYIFIIVSVLIYQVGSLKLCDNSSYCVCRYKNEMKHDFLGEIIDCSYKDSAILQSDHNLPMTVHSLDLSMNNITIVYPSVMLQSKTMKELYLNNNIITEIKLDSLQLPELKRLDLSGNSLETIHSDIFKSIKNLEYLNLANNKFTTFERLTFHRLSNLKEIILNGNDLGPSLEDGNLFDRSGFGLTNKIQSLYIRGINLNAVPDNFFVDAYDLRKLDISNNSIADVFELPFTLEYLDLSDNPIPSISSEDFADLPALKELKLNNLRIIEIPEYLFASLHSLTALEIERNGNLTQFSILAFGQEVLDDPDDFVLERLSIKNSRLSKLDKELLVPFGQLLHLDLQGNPWRCDCNLLWLKQLQITPNEYDHLRCFSPTPLFNARVFELDDKYFSCAANKLHVGPTLAIVSLCLVLTSIVIWLFLYLPKCQSRSNILREMYTPSTAYSILPIAPGSHVNDL